MLGAWLMLAAAPFAIERGAAPQIAVEGEAKAYVHRAVADVTDDLRCLFGETAADAKGARIVLKRGGTGFENYSLESKPGNVLEITGSDDRGMMFGLYRFASDFLGVDPLWWFARLGDGSSPSRAPRERLEWPQGISLAQGDPSFKYRGWFINDEDFLNGFMPEENGRRAIAYPRYEVCFGPTVADRLYEAAVRAGFNMMVCASYVDILNPDEKRLIDLASRRGLYITMHHQEPVGAGALQLDVHFPEMRGTTFASHPDLWRKAWRTYIRAWSAYPDVIFQIGLRGRKDLPFWTRPGNWDDARKVVDEAETRRRADLISQAMREQKAMIDELADKPHRIATQLWMEGSDFHRRGFLKIPDGTIVVFSDNCPGYKFQPDLGESSKRPCGHPRGLYYHLAIVQGNHRCEFVTPARTREILADAQAKGAREFLLVNVSNVRPFLYTIGAAAEMSRALDTFDAGDYAARWTRARFGRAADKVRRAIDCHFAGLECEYSRDASSSYGSSLPRAVLPVLNDGIVSDLSGALLNGREKFGGVEVVAGDPLSPYAARADDLASVPADQHSQTCQDMRTFFAQITRTGPRAAAQVAGLERASAAIAAAEGELDAAGRELLFHCLGYQTAFLREASRCLSELSLWRDAVRVGAKDEARRHLELALAASEARDALDRRYVRGVWAHWYDRDLIYPYTTLTERIRKKLRASR